MAYLGNLTCNDCDLTFTSRWGSSAEAEEFRCANDHVVHVEPRTGTLLSIHEYEPQGQTLLQIRGLCPLCATELATGLLPRCPVCGSRDHDVSIDGILE